VEGRNLSKELKKNEGGGGALFHSIIKIGRNKKLNMASLLLEGRITRSITNSHNRGCPIAYIHIVKIVLRPCGTLRVVTNILPLKNLEKYFVKWLD
jgi:hypothetical protein